MLKVIGAIRAESELSNYNSLDAKISSEASTRSARDVLLTNKINTEFSDLCNRMLYLESVVASLRNRTPITLVTLSMELLSRLNPFYLSEIMTDCCNN